MLAQSAMPALPLSITDDVAVPAVKDGSANSSGQECPAGLGVLTCEISPDLVDDVIEVSGCREQRRRLLPARAVLYFVLGLCLFSGADSLAPPGYRSVMRWLTDGLRHLRGVVLPTSSALTKARQRLGAKPLELLFDRLRGPVAGPATPGAFVFGLRLVAWDGTGLDAADTTANATAFGVTQGGNPQVRLLALIECGTHAVIDAAFDSVAKASEQKLARRVLHALQPGMLLLADRNFPGHELWGMAAATGADLVWRIKKNQVFTPVHELPDGSFISIMPTPAENVRYGQARAAGRTLPRPPQGHRVRIIEYTITVKGPGGSTRVEQFRLVTTLLDHRRAPARKLAALYHERWESENGYGELKTRLRGAAFILRSRLPELVNQEIFALLAVYQALCSLKAEAARTAGIDPDRISFTVTIRVARTHASSHRTSPDTVDQARREAIMDLLEDLVPPRRDRQCDRVKKPPKNTFVTKKRDQMTPSGSVKYKIRISRKALSPAQTP
ncbi:IS4 family transposase [Nonomuraea sp. 3N208]|uniref:IS4 family transposase n=1 Tax=Nonomuraea sp. 3N208 TaxID=3457421 RepID=UPI003FCF08C3